MPQSELEKQNLGAPDYKKREAELEQEIRQKVQSELPLLSPEAQEAVIKSRLKISSSLEPAKVTKIDLGKDASKKVKENLFE